MDIFGDLVLFEELAEHGSFSAVARMKGQAASSISRRLDRLESQLGQRLFNRAPTGLFLTAWGAHKLAEARTLTRAADSFLKNRDDSEALSGHIVVSAPSRLGMVAVAPVVADFLSENPGAALDLHLTDTIQDLDRDRIDMAVRIGGSAPDHYLIRRIAHNTRMLVASPGYLAQRQGFETVETLDECEGLILGSARTWTLRSRAGRLYNARPKARVTCVAGDALLALCEAGLGVALKSVWDVAPALGDGRLVRILPDWEQADTSDIMITMPDRRLQSPTLRAFEKRLEKHLKTLMSLV